MNQQDNFLDPPKTFGRAVQQLATFSSLTAIVIVVCTVLGLSVRVTAVVSMLFIGVSYFLLYVIAYYRKIRIVGVIVESHQRANAFLPRIAELIEESQEEIWFVGVNFYVTVPEHKNLLIEKLRQGVNIRFLIFDVLGVYLPEVARSFDGSYELLKSQCVGTVEALKEIHAAWQCQNLPGRLEIRLSIAAPGIRFYFFDRRRETAFTYFVPHVELQDSPNLPGFLAKNVKNSIVSTYVASAQKLWDDPETQEFENWLQKYNRILDPQR